MARLIVCFAIIFFIIMNIHLNESKPMYILSEFLEQSWPKDIDFPIERLVCKIIYLKKK